MTKVGHIYLIGDDESMWVSLSRMLRELGYLVEDYSSAATFLEKSIPVAPAVILLDMQTPDIDGRQLKRVSMNLEANRDYESLTPREREVCGWLVKGLLNKDIAVKLGTIDATIKVHKARVMDKKHADSVQTLVKKFLESNLENHPLSN